MFDYICGNIVHKTPTAIVIEANGIGYKLLVPLSTYEKVQDKKSAKILTRLLIRKEVELVIYGFSSFEERGLFNLLLSINGVGPSMALTILSSTSVMQFKEYVVTGDAKALVRIKGVGKKTAERIILELKESIAIIIPEEVSSDVAKKTAIISDAILALISLGYTRPAAENAVNVAMKNLDGPKVETLIKEALKHA